MSAGKSARRIRRHNSMIRGTGFSFTAGRLGNFGADRNDSEGRTFHDLS
jgi:hypothetical protein